MTDYYYDSSSVDVLEAFVAAFLGFFCVYFYDHFSNSYCFYNI